MKPAVEQGKLKGNGPGGELIKIQGGDFDLGNQEKLSKAKRKNQAAQWSNSKVERRVKRIRVS